MSYLLTVLFLSSLTIIRDAAGVEIGTLPTEQHAVTGILHVLDSNTLYIEDFTYDGGGPGAFLYYYAPGQTVDKNGGGVKIPLPPEFGKSDGSFKNMYYNDVDITVTMPEETDVCDIGTLTIWCQPFKAIFTRIKIPSDIFVNNGEDPCTLISDAIVTLPPPEFDNCIPLHETLQLSWRVDNDTASVRFRLCGCHSNGSDTNQYMGFGLSGSVNSTLMIGADPTIAWVDETDGPQAVDYYLSAYTQCRDGEGACPDEMDSSGSCTNDISNITGSVTDGQQCVSFTRQFSTSDSTCDTTIDPTNMNQYIVWAVGGLGKTAFKHFTRASNGDDPIHLGRAPKDQCNNTELVCQSCMPFENEQFIARENATFHARVGPSGNERGYMGITGRAGWGIAWHINGTLIPELVVERGKTYTFIVEGGNDSTDLSNYHPFYITNSIGGGRLQNTEVEIANETVYAGFNESDQPIAVGRLCQLLETPASQNTRESCSDLQTYIDTLETPASCNSGEPGKLVWTPDENTPDLVYYQCATHLNLGWKITVVDAVPAETEFDNCIPLHETLQLSWRVDSNNSNVRFRLCGCQSTDSNTNQYMGFGLSGSASNTQMFGADPTITWVDETDGPQAVDYYLSEYSPCQDGVGACPDEMDSSGLCTNDISNITGSVIDGLQCVSFIREFATSDSTCDITIDPDNTNQYIVWGVGGLGETAFKHFIRAEATDDPIHLGRNPKDQCIGAQFVCESCIPFENERIIALEDTTFQARIGPSGNERGYMGITGRAGWGISWYINGTLIPELVVERGKTYTFIIEGGSNSTDLSNYHPFYITDSISGGRLQNTEEEVNETVFAGFDENDQEIGVGHLCQLMETAASETTRESCSDLQTYIDTLETPASCNSGEPGKLVWTPDENTPDLVYYQCATHLNLGWKITVVDAVPAETEFDNCIPLHETLQLSWRVDNDNSNIRFGLCGCQSTDSNTNQYMGFGLSGSASNTQMFGADPTITWVDETDGPQAVDYYLSEYSPCQDGVGACPDEMDSSGLCTNDISNITGSVIDGLQCVSFVREFATSDSTCDITIDPDNTNQYIVWGVGGLGETAFKHFIRAEATDDPIHLGRNPKDQCIGAQFVCESCIPFENERIIALEDTTFQARIGPSGNERGYMGITGRAGWGISWYINGTLIPELVVERGKTYTFITEGGTDSSDLSNYHPFYITDSISGGRLQNTEEEKASETVFAGFDENDQEIGVGRLCQLMETEVSENTRESCSDLQTYIDTLETPASCNTGEPGKLVWTPDENTPDLVYYQCATHLNLGWKITVVDAVPVETEFDNCIPLHETLQLSWKVDNDNSNVRFRLCGCQSTDPNTNQYMGFGLSGSASNTQMFGADPTITWVDETDGPQAVDYYLSAYSPCSEGRGACPDEMDSSGSCTNDIINITGSVTDGLQCVSFTRKLSTSDSTCDITIDPDNTNQYIVWGVGGLGETAFKHFIRAEATDDPIHLGREPQDQCVGIKFVCDSCIPFENGNITAREDATFQARIGPSGNERGYMGITGRAGWGISWYINGTLIPELVVERGKTYTFIIEGGTDSTDLSNYHPFYITDSISGGRLQNTEEEKASETVFAGFDENDQEIGVGRLCQLMETEVSENTRESCSDLQNYIDTLETPASCNTGEPGRLVWTPDENTPDLVYYQCAAHLNLGWKIVVLDGDEMASSPDSTLHLEASLVMAVSIAIAGTFISL